MSTKIKQLIKGNAILYFPIKKYHQLNASIQNLALEEKAFLRKKGILRDCKQLEAYKNRFQGERCFIIATGPSLTMEDLELLKNEYTFGMNSICLALQQTDWRPTFYGIQDYEVFKRMQQHILDNKVENVFVAQYLTKKFKVPKEWIPFPLNSAYHVFDCYFKQKYYAKFSMDANQIVYDGYTITYSLIEIAAYMGFREIYLLGCDCAYSKAGKQHFIETGVVDPTFEEAGKRMKVAYQVAKEACDKQDIKIFNCTRGGELEVFERISLEKVLFP